MIQHHKDSYHNHKFAGLRRIGHVNGSHSLLKVLVCILSLTPVFQEESVLFQPSVPLKKTFKYYDAHTLLADPEEWGQCT